MSYIDELAAKVRKHQNVFVAPNATVIGDVTLEEDVSVWFGAVLRADSDSIYIGKGSNVQDNCVIHVDPAKPVKIGENVILGHSAIVHGATIGNNVLIGMRATILNNAKVGDWCLIGAHSLITESMVIPDRSLVLGSPGKVIRVLSEIEMRKILDNADAYKRLMKTYLRA